jgi:hypothetical protein
MQVLKEELREIFETAKNAEGLIKLLEFRLKSTIALKQKCDRPSTIEEMREPTTGKKIPGQLKQS